MVVIWHVDSQSSGSHEDNCLLSEWYPPWPGCKQSPPANVYLLLDIEINAPHQAVDLEEWDPIYIFFGCCCFLLFYVLFFWPFLVVIVC